MSELQLSSQEIPLPLQDIVINPAAAGPEITKNEFLNDDENIHDDDYDDNTGSPRPHSRSYRKPHPPSGPTPGLVSPHPKPRPPGSPTPELVSPHPKPRPSGSPVPGLVSPHHMIREEVGATRLVNDNAFDHTSSEEYLQQMSPIKSGDSHVTLRNMQSDDAAPIDSSVSHVTKAQELPNSSSNDTTGHVIEGHVTEGTGHVTEGTGHVTEGTGQDSRPPNMEMQHVSSKDHHDTDRRSRSCSPTPMHKTTPTENGAYMSDHVTYPLGHVTQSEDHRSRSTSPLVHGYIRSSDVSHDGHVTHTATPPLLDHTGHVTADTGHVTAAVRTASPSRHATSPTGHVTSPTDHMMTPTTGHVTPHVMSPTGHVMSPHGNPVNPRYTSTPIDHVTTPDDHVTSSNDHVIPNTQEHTSLPHADRATSPGGHVASPVGHVTSPVSHMTSPATSSSGHVTQPTSTPYEEGPANIDTSMVPCQLSYSESPAVEEKMYVERIMIKEKVYSLPDDKGSGVGTGEGSDVGSQGSDDTTPGQRNEMLKEGSGKQLKVVDGGSGRRTRIKLLPDEVARELILEHGTADGGGCHEDNSGYDNTPVVAENSNTEV